MSESSLQGKPEAVLRSSTLSTVIVMGVTFLSRLLGFVRIAVISALFGAGGKADVLNAVFNIPNNLRKLLAEGALSSAFIPVLSASLVTDASGEASRRVVRNIISFQFLILLPLLLVSTLFAEPVVTVILNFSDPAKIALSASLFRWLIHYLLLISISAVLMGVLNSHGSFGIPSVTPILFSVAVIAALMLLHRQIGIFSMVVGVLAGGVLQILFQYPRFRILGYDMRPDFRFRNDAFRSVMRQWLPVVATASVFTVNQHVAIWFATGLREGSASAMSYAIVFWQLPFGIFSASVTTVLFPRMSRQAAAKDSAGLGESLQYGIRFLMVLLIPSAVLMGILGRPLIAVALQRGEFGAAETALTAAVLGGYSWGLFSVGAFTFLQRFFYSLQDFRTPLWTALITSVVDVASLSGSRIRPSVSSDSLSPIPLPLPSGFSCC